MLWFNTLSVGPKLIYGLGLVALLVALIAGSRTSLRAAPGTLLRERFKSRSDRDCDHKSGASPRLIPL